MWSLPRGEPGAGGLPPPDSPTWQRPTITWRLPDAGPHRGRNQPRRNGVRDLLKAFLEGDSCVDTREAESCSIKFRALPLVSSVRSGARSSNLEVATDISGQRFPHAGPGRLFRI